MCSNQLSYLATGAGDKAGRQGRQGGNAGLARVSCVRPRGFRTPGPPWGIWAKMNPEMGRHQEGPPPCADAIIAAGIKRVVADGQSPDPCALA